MKLLRKANSERMLGASVFAFFAVVVAAFFLIANNRDRIGNLEDPPKRRIVTTVEVSIDACLASPACRRKALAAVERIRRQDQRAAVSRPRDRRAAAPGSSSPTSTGTTTPPPPPAQRRSPPASTNRPRRPGPTSPGPSSTPQPSPAPTPAPGPRPSIADVEAPLVPAQACTGVIDLNCR